MPVLPEHQSDAFRRGYENVDGLMSLSQRRAAEAEEDRFRAWEREVRRPVVEAQAKAQVSQFAADISTAKFRAEQTEQASRDIVEAQNEFKAMMADPLNTPMERLFNWKQNFSSYADLPGPHQGKFKAMADEIEHQAQTLRGRVEAETNYQIARDRKVTEELENNERIAALNEKAMKRAGGTEFGVPFKLRGTEQWVMWDELRGMREVEVRRNERVPSFEGGPEKSTDGMFFRSSPSDDWKPIKAPEPEKISEDLQMEIDAARSNVANLVEEVALLEAEAMNAPDPNEGGWFTDSANENLREKQAELAAARLRLQSLTGGAESAVSEGAPTSPEGQPAGTPAPGAPGGGPAKAGTPAGTSRAGPGKRAGIGALIGTAVWPGMGTAAGAMIGAATAPDTPVPPAEPTVPPAGPPGSISPEQAKALPPGTRYLGQDGRYRIR